MADDRCDLLCLDLDKAEDLRTRLLPQAEAEQAAAQVKAISDPTRLMLASALLDGDELCVCDLAWVSGRAENLVSHHLRQLRAAGLASSRREGKTVFYALTARARELLGLTLHSRAQS
jgi:ArsR family transcriptional regulator, lead/cadmium/zinc/bismuth-responsive transcriptional repressor